MSSRTPFPYSNKTLRLPKGTKERELAMARERAASYRLRNSMARPSAPPAPSRAPVAPLPAPAPVAAPVPRNNKFNKSRKRAKNLIEHKCVPDKDTILEFPDKDPENKLDLVPYVNAVLKQKREKNGKEGGNNIYSDATEYWFMDNFDCLRCNARNWIKCKARTPAFDCECNTCKTVYSIKSGHGADFKKKSQNLRIDACSRYSPLMNAHAKRVLDWILIHYDKGDNLVKHVYYVQHEKINADECIMAREPLGPHTKNPGWKGSKILFPGDIFQTLV